MSDMMNCPACDAPNQHIGKFCEQCGTRVEPAGGGATTGTLANAALPDQATTPTNGEARFILVNNGVLDMTRTFTVPRGSKLLIGRTDLSSDPARRTVPDVDVSAWARRVQTSDGPLYTIHRRQCYLSCDTEGVVRLLDYPDYPGDTIINPTGSNDFKTVADLAHERPTGPDGAVELHSGDRIIMGQGEGMLTFQLVMG